MFLLSRKGKFSTSLTQASLAFYLDPLVHTEQDNTDSMRVAPSGGISVRIPYHRYSLGVY